VFIPGNTLVDLAAFTVTQERPCNSSLIAFCVEVFGKRMRNVGFVPGWAGGGLQPRVVQSRKATTCRASCITRMSLVRHEKLEVLFEAPDYETATYRLDCEIPADISKDLRKRSFAAMKSTANFPGFRKGTIPPFILKSLVSWKVYILL
jgi:Bacterial trigger factor protein (TF)